MVDSEIVDRNSSREVPSTSTGRIVPPKLWMWLGLEWTDDSGRWGRPEKAVANKTRGLATDGRFLARARSAMAGRLASRHGSQVAAALTPTADGTPAAGRPVRRCACRFRAYGVQFPIFRFKRKGIHDIPTVCSSASTKPHSVDLGRIPSKGLGVYFWLARGERAITPDPHPWDDDSRHVDGVSQDQACSSGFCMNTTSRPCSGLPRIRTRADSTRLLDRDSTAVCSCEGDRSPAMYRHAMGPHSATFRVADNLDLVSSEYRRCGIAPRGRRIAEAVENPGSASPK
jgi:hypothetical protein